MEATITVSVETDRVRKALAETLTPQELASLKVTETEATLDPFAPDPRGEALTFVALITWVGGAVAGGVVGNAAYDGLKKVAEILIQRFGADRVALDEPPET